MQQLSISLFGSFQVDFNQQPIIGFRSAKAQALLAYLVVESERPSPRNALLNLFWPQEDADTARTNLRQTIYRLQKSLDNKNATPPFLLIWRDAIQFNQNSQYELDIDRFQTLLKACPLHKGVPDALCEPCVENLETAVSLYRGDFLAHFFVGNSSPFEEWLTLKREALHQQALAAMQWLANNYERFGKYQVAYRYAQRQIELEPWREEAYQQQMRLLMRQGKRSAALARYKTCCYVLEEELGVGPSPETRALYQRLQTLSEKRPHNLPQQTTSFLGRESETAQLIQYLTNPQRRLVTLMGMGGMGKTRLSLHVAHRIAKEHLGPFSDGIFQIPLVGIEREEQMVTAVANTLNIPLNGAIDPQQQVFKAIKDKELLLLFDNFEQLVETGSSFINGLLQKTTAVNLLITSRERLNLQGEWLLPLPGLPYPQSEPGTTITPQQIDPQNYEAIQLFIERAQQAQPDFESEQSWQEKFGIIRICQLCEGVPLALELAAAWVKTLSCAEIAAEIEQNINILKSTYRNVDPRHQSLRAVFEHSWQLLSQVEQQMLAKLSVFRGGFTLGTAQQVAYLHPQNVNNLIGKSLINPLTKGRYELHELLRQFSAEKLNEYGLTEEINTRYAAYYADFIEQKEKQMGTQQEETVAAIMQEIQNVRAGWVWAATNRKVDLLQQYLPGLLDFYAVANWYWEGQQAFELCTTHLLDTTSLTDGKQDSNHFIKAKALVRQAMFCLLLGQIEKAARLAKQAITILPKERDFAETSFAYNILGGIYYELGSYEDSLQMLQNSYQAAQHSEDKSRKANLCQWLGKVAIALGKYDQAKKWYGESLKAYTDTQRGWGIGLSLLWLGVSEHALGDLDQAEEYYQRSLTIFEEIEYESGIASCNNRLGILAQTKADYEQAEQHHLKSLSFYQENGIRIELARTLTYLGDLSGMTGAFDEAKDYLFNALHHSSEIKSTPVMLQSLASTAGLMLKTAAVKMPAQVEHPSQQSALTTADESNNQQIQAFALFTLVANHPSSHYETRLQAELQLDKIKMLLPPQQIELLREKISNQQLKAVVASMLEDGSR